MKLRSLFTISAVLFFIWGVVLFFAESILGIFALELVPTDVELYLARAIATVMIGMGITAWMIRDSGPSVARDAVVVGFVISNILAVITNLIAIIDGTASGIAWVGIILNGLLAIVFFLAGWPGRTTE
jgi:ABC-type uncharacterized transport system permease subunit